MTEPSSPCPEPELLERMAEGLLSWREKRRVQEHLQSCPACLTALTAVWDLAAEAREAHRHSWQSALNDVRGRMQNRERAVWERHLESCVRCGTRVELLRRLLGSGGRERERPGAEEFRGVPRSQVFWAQVRAGGTAFAVCLLLVAVGGVFTRFPSPEPVGGAPHGTPKGGDGGTESPAGTPHPRPGMSLEQLFPSRQTSDATIDDLIHQWEAARSQNPGWERNPFFAYQMSVLYGMKAAKAAAKRDQLTARAYRKKQADWRELWKQAEAGWPGHPEERDEKR